MKTPPPDVIKKMEQALIPFAAAHAIVQDGGQAAMFITLHDLRMASEAMALYDLSPDTNAPIRDIVSEWQDKQGHDRCWYYPDLFNKLATLLGIAPKNNPELPPRGEFEEGCRRYQAEQFP